MWELLLKGGFVMPPLVVGAIVLWYAVGVRIQLLFGGDMRPVRLVLADIQDGRLNEIRGVMAGACFHAHQAVSKAHEGFKPRIQEALQPVRLQMKIHRKLISGIVRIAPLLGLLGTVSGMIETFDSLGSMTLMSQSGGGVAGGISEALFSTQMGLLVAIPGVLAGRLLERREALLEGRLDQLAEILSQGRNAHEAA